VILDDILAWQSESGAFRSAVTHGGQTFIDENAFVTALVATELSALNVPVGGALDFLEQCRRDDGAFGFYPRGAEPAWMGTTLAADADDTALCTLLFLQHGRITAAEASRVIADVLDPHRLHFRPEATGGWIQRGAYRTWLDRRAHRNPVDLCVNANVASLLAASQQRGAAYDSAWRTVAAGIEWLARNPALLHHLTPFYPHPSELREAVRRAVDSGVGELAPALLRLSTLVVDDADDTTPVCSSEGGATLWIAAALQLARRLRSAVRINRKEIQ
jgi:hypothetical protein